ncbi:hypothetical protein RRG08_017743 [Elysia crispata]|uniref:Secreted protein n=1 Tax=Elysia crispata TaxID=231223 RepID=A0AAE0XQT9_9GAST|nr:hypothetical protein RRG08_017743 [Elysia crispata]
MEQYSIFSFTLLRSLLGFSFEVLTPSLDPWRLKVTALLVLQGARSQCQNGARSQCQNVWPTHSYYQLFRIIWSVAAIGS